VIADLSVRSLKRLFQQILWLQNFQIRKSEEIREGAERGGKLVVKRLAEVILVKRLAEV
jgi:hypothetical protein